MNILCVGNSFAVDASTYVHQIAEAAGYDINIYVIYYPGCPISYHWENYLNKNKVYEFYLNGNKQYLMKCDLFEALTYTKYDYVTFQQRSGDSVDSKTFFPDLIYLMEGVRKYTDGTYLLHKTWSYAEHFSHEKYGSNPMNQDAMDKDIKQAYLEVSDAVQIPYIIPSGEAIRLARLKYGDNLNRDGFHLNERGRTLVGILWVFYFLKRTDLDISKFTPTGQTYDDFTPPIDKQEIPDLIEIVKQALNNNQGFNL